MRIGLISKFGEKDGIALYSDNLAKSLRKQGAEVVTIGGVDSISDYRINLKSVFLGKKISSIVNKEDLDVVHFQYIADRRFYGLHTLNLNFVHAIGQKVPVVTTLHEVHLTAGSIHEKVVKALEKSIVRRSTATVVHTVSQRNFIKKNYGVDAVRIHHGLYEYPMHKKKGKNLLFFGIISKAKGVDVLLDAMDELRGFNLFVCGSVVDEGYRKLLSTKLGKLKNASYQFGWVSEQKKEEIMKNCDIMVLPYRAAPYQSGVLHNSLSYGIVPVVTRTGAIWEIVEEFGCGEVARPNDSRSLALAIRRAEKKYPSLQKGIASYRKEANWNSVARKHIELYSSLFSSSR